MACPHVAGAVALLLQHRPGLTVGQIRRALENSALDLGDTGKDNKFGWGRISVKAALEALPEEYRVVSTLYFLQDFSYPEIADVLGCPVGTVRSRLHRGRRLLQKKLWKAAVDSGVVRGMQEQETRA